MDWKIIIQEKDLNERVGKHNSPKVISTNELTFDNKEKAFKKFGELIVEYENKSYDFKAHSFGALKFYHEIGDKDVLTVVLLYYKGEEYMEATKAEEELLDNIIDSD